MALCCFPSCSPAAHHVAAFSSSSSSKLNKFQLGWEAQYNPVRRNPIFSCSAEKSSKKGRASKPTKSNEDLCREIRVFIATVGLPEDRVPSMKELCEHGRKDLANIVRRRGYKLMTELLRKSTKMDSNMEKILVEDRDSSNACKGEASEIQEMNLIESTGCSSLVGTYMVRANGAMATGTSVQIFEPLDSSSGSLHLKATNFIQTGELNILEDASKVEDVHMPNEPELNSGILSSNGADTAHMASQQSLPPLAEQHPDRNQAASREGLIDADFNEDEASEAGERDNQTEIDDLKAMLHHKEMELSELKQQIEKEKEALCNLQAKATNEISNVHRLVSAKDVELRAAEESLSGLKEVQIEYWGDGETVEVSGSFNGWHHRIKMDQHPSSKTINPPGSRNSRLWSTVLWLYPGIYEIKFIVDGHWRIDSQREIVTSGNIMNNVLRVER